MKVKSVQGRAQWLVEHMGKGAETHSSLMGVLPMREDRAALQRIINPCNWELHWTATCAEALDVFRRTNPTIVICERDLPDGNWRELWDALAREPNPPTFIVTSRLADDALWAEVLNLGGYDLLLKPFRPEEVIRVVHSAAIQRSTVVLNRHQTFESACRAV